MRKLAPQELRALLLDQGEDISYVDAVVETVSSGLMSAFIENGEIFYGV
jgi:hypothetical protein